MISATVPMAPYGCREPMSGSGNLEAIAETATYMDELDTAETFHQNVLGTVVLRPGGVPGPTL